MGLKSFLKIGIIKKFVKKVVKQIAKKFVKKYVKKIVKKNVKKIVKQFVKKFRNLKEPTQSNTEKHRVTKENGDHFWPSNLSF